MQAGWVEPEGKASWVDSERASFWIALAIALGPIPFCLLVSWALGSPPWKARPAPVPADPPAVSEPHGHR